MRVVTIERIPNLLEVGVSQISSSKNNHSRCQRLISLVFTLLFLLTACHEKELPSTFSKLRINQPNAQFAKSLNLPVKNNFKIKTFAASSLFPFDNKNQSVLIRIKTLDYDFQPSEATLVVEADKLESVYYFQLGIHNSLVNTVLLDRIKTSTPYAYTAHRFAFNIDQQNIHNYHYLLIKSTHRNKVSFELLNNQTFIKKDSNKAQLDSLLCGLLGGLMLLGGILFWHNKDKTYLFFLLYITTALLALLWQNNLIHKLPWLVWPILGVNTNWVFIILSDLFIILLTFKLMEQRYVENKYHKALTTIVSFRGIVTILGLIQYQVTAELSSYYFNVSMTIGLLLNYFLLILLISQNKSVQNTSKKLLILSWLMLFTYYLIHAYCLFFPTTASLSTSFGSTILLTSLFLFLAVATKNIRVKAPIVLTTNRQADNKTTNTETNRSFLLKQFKYKMEQLVNDASLNKHELFEKMHIKLYLLLNRALPIKNAFILENGKITTICKAKFKDKDIEHLRTEAIKSTNVCKTPSVVKGSSISLDKNHPAILFVPLSQQMHPKTTMIFGLKKNADPQQNYLKGITQFCDKAYSSLEEGRAMCSSAVTNNTDNLTGLYNNTGINAIIKKSLRKGRITAAASIEVTNLKHIQQEYNETIYNQCVTEFTSYLHDLIKVPVKLGRLDKTQFMAVFSSIDIQSCEKALFKFLSKVEHKTYSIHALNLNINIGLAESHMNETEKSLIRKANFALNHVISEGPYKMVEFGSKMIPTTKIS